MIQIIRFGVSPRFLAGALLLVCLVLKKVDYNMSKYGTEKYSNN